MRYSKTNNVNCHHKKACWEIKPVGVRLERSEMLNNLQVAHLYYCVPLQQRCSVFAFQLHVFHVNNDMECFIHQSG